MSDPSDSLVIFLHGVGANGADLAPLADTLLPFLPASVFASPDGPERFDGGGSGRQWFSVAGVTQANRSDRVQHARAAFDRVVSSEIEKHGFAGRLDRIAFFGFSQGAIMALDAVATGRWPLRAAVAASGRLATAPEAKTEHFTKILLMHGENDPVIPAQETRLAAERLRAAGFEVEAKLYPGLGHVLSPEGVQTAGKFLARQLGHA
jgi:phospholipase/carboxylesterase